ncbi:hypothetical protein SAMN02745216_04210 [Desulfatibacillum alkenivorans DSM 16219]|jgi:peptide deformylase|uniref:MJ0042 family finger-like domain-containing protein n=1 Tax=Desulfatibacillum alkenivorans DSM 16219 TaxID=1121393 RepID=A0A1M6VY40_9BACT|nr:hypothetical protein [Desulfatibacillum alkenivorans]SHK86347.1 hypothetical protein SAMN02745216_04210 [Desulfatibacillum alkenivorans DSM 16219]
METTIIFCEECGHKNVVPLEALEDKSKPIKCEGCLDILRIVKKDERNPEVKVKKSDKDDTLF